MSNLLSLQPESAAVRVVKIDGGVTAVKKIQSLGIFKGAEIKVVRASHRGPLIIEVKGTKLAIGRGMADKIIVE